MKHTTLCYIERDGNYLMLHRTKKENDLNHDKWIGVGGKVEENESPEECLLREGEYLYRFHASEFTGTLAGCADGELVWVKKENVLALPTWEGDRIFLQKMAAGDDFFTLKLRYEGDLLCEAVLNGTQRLKG